MTLTGFIDGSHNEDPAANRVSSRQDRANDLQLLRESKLVDTQAYRIAANIPPAVDPIEHYLLQGWREGFEPREGVQINWQYPFFCSLGLDDPPPLTFLTLRAAGCATFVNRAQAEASAEIVRNSGLFDSRDYAAH